MSNVSLEIKKVEAINRMKELGIYEQVVAHFDKHGLVCYSEPPLGAFFVLKMKV